ncbi:Glycosyltransferase involved in cell wall bisynthesis [Microbacterium azadirachtae]|uniref:Glycosyltransferase involved in cell wall bisynthesis n=1 Tax=Microbacterium azadirachtae TaxID=582680 RepID=A0A1I6JGX0_9MICO|nr:glycosyltransferase family 4 protein [Microbacterium azadirachtae]SFR78211.1 Glycosyltransferase involved in cell wall bisynthesis [Microbacterium azadirachtae]
MSDAARPLRAVEPLHAIDDRDVEDAWKSGLFGRAEHALAAGGWQAGSSGGFPRVYVVADHAGLGGSEVMLLRIASVLRELGADVTAVVPDPSPVLIAAVREGLSVIALPARHPATWAWALRRWDRTRPPGLLWCNGLTPSAATLGRRDRLVHLHRRPSGLRGLVATLARRGAVATLVPSCAMLEAAPGAVVLPNWTDRMRRANPHPDEDGRIRIGFLGPLGLDSGVHVLAEAVEWLEDCMPGRYRLVLAGEPVGVPEEDLALMEEALGPVAHLTHRTGWVDTAALFDGIDLLVVPSVVDEAFGLVATEAMAARVPLIVSDAGALPEVVGPRGEIVPAADPIALAERIADLTAGSATAKRGPLFERWFAEYSPGAGAARMHALVDALGVRTRDPMRSVPRPR